MNLLDQNLSEPDSCVGRRGGWAKPENAWVGNDEWEAIDLMSMRT